MKDENMIEVILLQAGREAKPIKIENNLTTMQKIVDGYIEEYMPFPDDVAIVCNEEGKMRGMDLNRAIKGEDGEIIDIICGDCFLCYAPIESEDFLSMPGELKEKYLELFRKPEVFFRTESGIKAVPLDVKPREKEREEAR